LAATAAPLRSLKQERSSTTLERSSPGVFAVSALTILAVAVHGYHPYAEDGGLYLAGIKRVLHPDLYPFWSGFTTAHLRFSLFAPIVAFLVRASHLSLMAVMLLLYVGTIWATLFAAWQIARRCFSRMEECFGAVSLLALLLTVPVAGTSLMMMDPYVSARSISTPCSLFLFIAIGDITRQINQRTRISSPKVILCLGALFVAIIVHPLMGIYALGSALVLAIASVVSNRLHWAAYGGLSVVAIVSAALLLRFAPQAPSGYMEVARTRTYWFLSTWHWYELIGIIAPLLVLAIFWRRPSSPSNAPVKSFAQMGLIVGGLSTLIALLFARIDMSSYAVAKLQPLRAFQIVYIITILFVGATIGRIALKRYAWRWIGMLATVSTLMSFVQLAAFPDSSHLEMPWVTPTNAWERAFVWIRENTDKNAVFAMDAAYINAPGEDAQNFRAIAERSAVPDYSKDGGIASIAPDLTADWINGESAQNGLDHAADAFRIALLRHLGVRWVILSGDALTQFNCDYVNREVKVCRLPKISPHPKLLMLLPAHPRG
jgi:hypothetical protein